MGGGSAALSGSVRLNFILRVRPCDNEPSQVEMPVVEPSPQGREAGVLTIVPTYHILIRLSSD